MCLTVTSIKAFTGVCVLLVSDLKLLLYQLQNDCDSLTHLNKIFMESVLFRHVSRSTVCSVFKSEWAQFLVSEATKMLIRKSLSLHNGS